MKELELNTIESSELVEQTFQFWYSDHGHLRSPFPSYIRPELTQAATLKFFEWSRSLKPEAKDELNDEMVGEKFEEIIFEMASQLVKTDDEHISILYPFMPRLEDKISDDNGNPGKIVDRHILKEKDHSFLCVTCENETDASKWKTRFELPI